MNPEPIPLLPPAADELRAVMVTTEGMTRATAPITALDSSIRTWLTLLPTGAFRSLEVAGRSRLATAAAESEPETMAVTRAIATTPAGPTRLGSCGPPDPDAPAGQIGPAPQASRVGWVGAGPKCCTSIGAGAENPSESVVSFMVSGSGSLLFARARRPGCWQAPVAAKAGTP